MCTIYDMLIPCKKLYWLELYNKRFFQFSHLGAYIWVINLGYSLFWVVFHLADIECRYWFQFAAIIKTEVC